MSTPRQGHAPIPMRRVALGNDIERAGDYAFAPYDSSPPTHIWLAVPSTKRQAGWESARLPITGGGWTWNGDIDKPTLSPSVHTVGVWHGWVRDGQLVEA